MHRNHWNVTGRPRNYVTRLYEFTPSGILCTNHINCRDQLCVNLDTGELIHSFKSMAKSTLCQYTNINDTDL